MPKLYYTPTSCGAASFIAAFTAGISVECEQVNLQTHKTMSGGDLMQINPKGNVPTLVLENGVVLNENLAVLQYIADLKPGTIAPVNGTIERVVLQNILSFLASEVHTSIGGLFNPSIGNETRQYLTNNANKKLSYIENFLLKDKTYLLGNSFTIADCYLYIILSWTKGLGIDIRNFPKTNSYFEKIVSLPSVKSAYDRINTSPSTTY